MADIVLKHCFKILMTTKMKNLMGNFQILKKINKVMKIHNPKMMKENKKKIRFQNQRRV